MRYGQKTITSRTRSLWSKLPKECKLSKSPKSFKRRIKNWKGNAKLSPVVSAKLFKNILVLNNVILFVCLFVCSYYLFYSNSDVSSVSYTVERMNQ